MMRWIRNLSDGAYFSIAGVAFFGFLGFLIYMMALSNGREIADCRSRGGQMERSGKAHLCLTPDGRIIR